MPRHSMVDNKKVYFTAEEEAARDAEEAQWEADKPMESWLDAMRYFPMSRGREDHITDVNNGVAGSPEEQLIYDSKITLRATKP